MSIGGDIHFFTDRIRPGPAEVRRLFEYFSVPLDVSDVVSVRPEETMGMEYIKGLLRQGLDEPDGAQMRFHGVDGFCALRDGGHTRFWLLLSPNSSSRARALHDALAAAIPEAVRQDFAPLDKCIRLGMHGVFQDHPEWLLFGRSEITISFGGYGCPGDRERYRGLAFEIPFVKRLRADVESILGSLQCCASWSC